MADLSLLYPADDGELLYMQLALADALGDRISGISWNAPDRLRIHFVEPFDATADGQVVSDALVTARQRWQVQQTTNVRPVWRDKHTVEAIWA